MVADDADALAEDVVIDLVVRTGDLSRSRTCGRGYVGGSLRASFHRVVAVTQ